MNSGDIVCNIQNELHQSKKDYTNLYASRVTNFSSNWSNSSNAGTFPLNVNHSTDNSNANITAHLKFSFSHCFQDPGS